MYDPLNSLGCVMRETIGKYRVIRELGHGAMGTVFLGEDDSIGRQVAIKTIRTDSTLGAESKARFFREAQACGALNHPNIVTIYDFGEDGDFLYLAMEYIPGEDLHKTFLSGDSSSLELLELFAQICDGLQHAHERGVIHRDIKPSNILVTKTPRGMTAKIVDFGVARTANSDLTNSGIIMGTVSYLAPEYINSGDASHLSDLFSLAVMAFEGLAGRKPFCGDSTAAVLLQILTTPAPLLTNDEMKGLNPGIQGILQQALAKNPADRFSSAEAFGMALRKAKVPGWDGQSVPREPALSADERETEPLSRPGTILEKTNKNSWLAGAAALLLVTVGGVWIYRSQNKIPSQPTPPPEVSASGPGAPISAAADIAKKGGSPVQKLPPQDVKPPDIKKLGEALLKEPPHQAMAKLRDLTKQYPDQPSAYAIYLIVLIKNQDFTEVDRVRNEAGAHGITLDQMKRAYPQLAEVLSVLSKSTDSIKDQGEASLKGDPIQAVETLRAMAQKHPEHQEIQAMYLITLVKTRKSAEFDQARASLKARGMSLEILKKAYPPLAQVLALPSLGS